MAKHFSRATPPLPESLQSAPANDLIVIHQDQYNQWLRAKDALDGLAWLFCEVAGKAINHPGKDGFISVPAESMAALVWAVWQVSSGSLEVKLNLARCCIARHRAARQSAAMQGRPWKWLTHTTPKWVTYSNPT